MKTDLIAEVKAKLEAQWDMEFRPARMALGELLKEPASATAQRESNDLF